ncbi:MAG: alpha/beta fold hydrolase [Chloroflexota bacterium]
MTRLISEGYIDAAAGFDFLKSSNLTEFRWEVTWPEDYETPDEQLIDRISSVQGYGVFIHGWTGNYAIWEELPGMLVMSNRRMVAMALDHNGFGESTFESATPAIDSCNPPAAMRTIERWIDLMNLRRQAGEPNRKVINLIGHSMGGATLFYLNPIIWNDGEITRYALAPALLLEDEQFRRFYTTLGVGIGILQRVSAFKFVERLIKPTMIRTLCAGSTDLVQEVHSAQYNATPRGVTGATFVAMGQLDNFEIARNWEFMRVMLGHRDRLVGLTGMMDLLSKLEFPAAHTRVVAGSHYMFSVGGEDPQNAFQHAQARELVVEDILELQSYALKVQKEGRLVGG